MASITTSGDGLRRLQFSDASGTRRTVALGRMPVKQAETVKRHVEAIVTATVSQCSVAMETARWLEGMDDVLRDKLAKAGLVQARANESMVGFVERYIESRGDAKPTTKVVWRRALRHLKGCFGTSRTLSSFTISDGKNFRLYLVNLKLAEATVRRMCGVAKQYFQDALERELVSRNVFRQRGIPTSVGSDQARAVYVPRETIEVVIDACPDARWRLIVALSRYAGLRCPSETLLLRWKDVNWERGRITVRSPKTEHHEGKASRVIPIFHELRPYLEEAYEVYGEKTEFVVAMPGNNDYKLRTKFSRIVERSGVKPWPKLFHNLRASCETDLAKVHPIKSVCDWLGNSVSVAAKHYLVTTDDDFDKATQNPTQSPPDSDRQPLPKILTEMEKRSESRVSRISPPDLCGLSETDGMGMQVNTLRQTAITGDAESYVMSPDMTSAEWMALPENARELIIRLFRERDELLNRFASMRQQAGSARGDITLP